MPDDQPPFHHRREGRVLPVIQHMVRIMAGQGITYCGQHVYDEDMQTMRLSYATDWIAVTCPECIEAGQPEMGIPVLVIPVDEAEALLQAFCTFLRDHSGLKVQYLAKEFLDGHPKQTQSIRAAARRAAGR